MDVVLSVKKNYIDHDVIVTRSIGLLFTAKQIECNRSQLIRNYSVSFLTNAGMERIILDNRKDFNTIKAMVSEKSSTNLPRDKHEPYLFELGINGIFGGLWSLGQELQSGLTIDLNKIPISQQTVEVSEFFNCNPYREDSKGSYLIVTALGSVMIEDLMAAGIPAVIIGRLTKGNARIIRNLDEIRYLTPPSKGAAEHT